MSTARCTCGNCGAEIPSGSETAEDGTRQPCPQCGSTARAFHVQASGGITIGGSAQASLTRYPDTLLSHARDSLDGPFPGVAVLLAPMACEVATQLVLTKVLAKRGISCLEGPIDDLLNGYNLGNDRLRSLFFALTGDRVQDQPFWPQFAQSAERRNQVAHSGRNVPKQEASESFDVAEKLLTHLYPFVV